MVEILKNSIISLAILCLCFLLCLAIKYIFNNSALISAIFVLGVYLISVMTSGYIYGIVSALLCVLAVNFAFDSPFFEFNFTIAENIVSAVILLIVTMMTCGLTAKVKRQEAIKGISENSQWLYRMVENLLSVTRLDGGNVKIIKTETVLDELVDSV